MDANVILQIINPIIISQKTMNYQFDNNYSALLSSVKFNIAFEEHFGNLFLRMSEIYSSVDQKEMLYNFVCYARLLCGPNIAVLNDPSSDCAQLLGNVMHQWKRDFLEDYASLLDGVNCFLVGPDKLKSIAMFMEAELKVIGSAMGSKYHVLLLYRGQLVRHYSAPQATSLSSRDVGNLISLSYGVLQNRTTQYFNAFLHGQTAYECLPHVVAVTAYEEYDLKLIIAVESGNVEVARSIYKSLSFLNKVYNFTVRLDADTAKVVVDKIDFYLNHVQQCIKSAKGCFPNISAEDLDGLMKSLEKKWTAVKKKLSDLMKISYKDVLKTLDSSLPSLIESLQGTFRAIYIDGHRAWMNNEKVSQLCESSIVSDLRAYHTIFSLNQHGALVHSFKEEFHGLIHFIFINKTTGRIIAPQLADPPIIDRKTVSHGQGLGSRVKIGNTGRLLFADPTVHKDVEKVHGQGALVQHLEERVLLFLVLYVVRGECGRGLREGEGRD